MLKGMPMNHLSRLKHALLACTAGLSLMAANPVIAREVDSTRLLELMVAKGLVTREEADGLIAEASTRPASLPPVPAGGVDAQGVQTIPYVPAVVRDQIKAELKAELGTQAQTQGWAAPGQTPDWTRRIQIYGDVRVRGEGRFYDEGNADIFTNYGAINTGDPQNINDKTPGWVAPPGGPSAGPAAGASGRQGADQRLDQRRHPPGHRLGPFAGHDQPDPGG
jgi:Putative porin